MPEPKRDVSVECALRQFNRIELFRGDGRIKRFRYRIRVFWPNQIVKRALDAMIEKDSKSFSTHSSIGFKYSIETRKLWGASATSLNSQIDTHPVRLSFGSTQYHIDPRTGDSDLHMESDKTSLMALLEGDKEKLRILIETRNFAGQTALHAHVLARNVGCIMALVANGIKLDEKDHNGDTALHIVASVCQHSFDMA